MASSNDDQSSAPSHIIAENLHLKETVETLRNVIQEYTLKYKEKEIQLENEFQHKECQYQAQIESLEQKISEYKSNIGALNKTALYHQQTLSELSSQLSQTQEHDNHAIQKLKATVSDQQNEIKRLQNEIDHQNTILNQQQYSIASLQEKLKLYELLVPAITRTESSTLPFNVPHFSKSSHGRSVIGSNTPRDKVLRQLQLQASQRSIQAKSGHVTSAEYLSKNSSDTQNLSQLSTAQNLVSITEDTAIAKYHMHRFKTSGVFEYTADVDMNSKLNSRLYEKSMQDQDTETNVAGQYGMSLDVPTTNLAASRSMSEFDDQRHDDGNNHQPRPRLTPIISNKVLLRYSCMIRIIRYSHLNMTICLGT